MARYLVLRETWLSDQCKKVFEGEEIEIDNPNFKPSNNLELIEELFPSEKKPSK